MVFPKIPTYEYGPEYLKKIAYFLKNCHILSRNSPFLGIKSYKISDPDIRFFGSGYHIRK